MCRLGGGSDLQVTCTSNRGRGRRNAYAHVTHTGASEVISSVSPSARSQNKNLSNCNIFEILHTDTMTLHAMSKLAK